MMVCVIETHMKFILNSEEYEISGLQFLRADFFTHMNELFSRESVKWNMELITKCSPYKSRTVDAFMCCSAIMVGGSPPEMQLVMQGGDNRKQIRIEGVLSVGSAFLTPMMMNTSCKCEGCKGNENNRFGDHSLSFT